jgi:hypothetical protein
MQNMELLEDDFAHANPDLIVDDKERPKTASEKRVSEQDEDFIPSAAEMKKDLKEFNAMGKLVKENLK